MSFIDDAMKKINEVQGQALNQQSQALQIARLEYSRWAVEMSYTYGKSVKQIFREVEDALIELTKPKEK